MMFSFRMLIEAENEDVKIFCIGLEIQSNKWYLMWWALKWGNEMESRVVILNSFIKKLTSSRNIRT